MLPVRCQSARKPLARLVNRARINSGSAGGAHAEHDEQNDFQEPCGDLALGPMAPEIMAKMVDRQDRENKTNRLKQRLAMSAQLLANIGIGDRGTGDNDFRVVSDVANGLNQTLRSGSHSICGHLRGFRQQLDRGMGDAGDTAQGLLHAGRATAAGHAVNS